MYLMANLREDPCGLYRLLTRSLLAGRYCTRIPEGVSDEEAGPIMCGGVTGELDTSLYCFYADPC